MQQTVFSAFDRVQITTNVKRGMFSYTAGQKGTVLGYPSRDRVFVRLDGYWWQKLGNIIRQFRRGEGSNFVPWHASFTPAELKHL